MSPEDKRLGMDRAIARRDFLQGAAVAVGTLGVPSATWAAGATPPPAPQDTPGYYPPALQGLRGSHPGAFEAAHALRDGTAPAPASDTGETYDLIVVGGGISGLAAAWFWRREHPQARVLILENHDDFGGHAKRNEFVLGGKLQLMNGGTLLIDSPRPYSPQSSGMMKALGVDPVALTAKCNRPGFYKGMGHGVFFDRATFGADRLVAHAPGGWHDDEAAGDRPDAQSQWGAFLAQTPLSQTARADVLRIETSSEDPLPGLDARTKADRLSRISYAKFLTDLRRAGAEAMKLYQTRTHGEWAVGIDAVSALDCWGFGYPGFGGVGLDKKAHYPRMSFTPAGYAQTGGSDTFHFPDGNASIARLLVRALIPGALPGEGAESIVGARCDYTRLDRPGAPVRLRLSATVLRVENAAGPGPVRVTYARDGGIWRANAGRVILASWNAMIPYLMPELPEPQKAAMHALVKSPLVYTTVALRNWEAWHRLEVSAILAPGAYYTNAMLNWPVAIGGVTPEADSARPVLAAMHRTPCAPGMSEHDQNRAGRAELLGTPFETFERETRAQLAGMLDSGGFDPARDVIGLTVNRWPHGYAPEYNPLWQPDLPEDQLPHIVARRRFGRVAIANSDSGNGAYTDVAIDQAWRAVTELA